MAISYRLEVVGLEAYPQSASYQNLVHKVFARYWAEEDGQSVVKPIQSDVSFDPADFVPFQSLTAEIVKGWIEPGLDIPALQLELSQSLVQRSQPKESEIVPVPWGN
jgi:hypothetical protein